jgi:hypothetical protein
MIFIIETLISSVFSGVHTQLRRHHLLQLQSVLQARGSQKKG